MSNDESFGRSACVRKEMCEEQKGVVMEKHHYQPPQNKVFASLANHGRQPRQDMILASSVNILGSKVLAVQPESKRWVFGLVIEW